MDFHDVKIDLREVNSWIKNRFPKKDIISFAELLGDYEDLISEVENLEEKIKDIETDIENNYKRIHHADPYEDRYL